ncbi:hypothetical protein BGX21_001691 [Mortierella sp. AD011]|nr:hypothetical protein BGX20_008023 [Mortierella sp. AD010]KAF9401432.1 hypothetical protein BGX21_001691 [Mortierella sp. AD011]
MDDLEMDEAFDFKALSLDEPEDRLTRTFEQSFHVSTVQEQQQQQEHATSSSAIPYSTHESLTETNPTTPEIGSQSTIATETPDNGPWAKIPSGSDASPFQPGITAEKLDAMAMDPNHVFKSAQAPDSFPFTVVPPVPSSEINSKSSKATAGSNVSSTKGKSKMELSGSTSDQSDQDKIPEWMLADPELTPQPGWGPKDATGPSFTSQDFTLDWSSSGDHSTAMDPNVLFGFSSYPTYESLSISNAIADEQYRRVTGTGSESGSGNTFSSTSQGGFAKYGSSASGDAADAQAFGYRGFMSGSIPNNHHTTEAAATSSTTNSQQWQNWRSGSSSGQDLDLDLDIDALDESPKIK